MRIFKIRASAAGNIMTKPKAKSEIYSQTAITYVETWLKEQIYNRKYDVITKYMQKGNIVEDNAIDRTGLELFIPGLVKNQKSFEDEHMTGTPDIITGDSVVDVKSSWDCFTFPFFDDEIKNKNYIYQLQCYMNLTGKSKAKLVYSLEDTPEFLIRKEAYYYCLNNGYETNDQDVYDMFAKKMTYNDIPHELRIKIFEIEKDDNIIDQIKVMVELYRGYVSIIANKIKHLTP